MWAKYAIAVLGLCVWSAQGLKPRSDVSEIQSQIWDYGSDKIRGISLGGWFVLEPYITPSLFEKLGNNDTDIPVDEYTFCQKLGKEEAAKVLTKHWEEYYTEDDFKDIKNYGLNLVRIPVGYWAFAQLDDDPYVQGQEPFIDKAIQWAKSQGLKVWFDLHGVPGSQNGFDNSGKRGKVGWQDDPENLNVTTKALDYIFDKYGVEGLSDTIIGIEIVNEPKIASLNASQVLQFTYDSYYDYRKKYTSENWFLVQDGFTAVGYWNNHLNNAYSNVSKPYTKNVSSTVLKDDYFNGIVIDHHHYEVFTTVQLEKTRNERANDIINYGKAIATEQKYHPSLVGEWSGAVTDCARWLNGVGTGARYDGTFSSDQLLREDEKNRMVKLNSGEPRSCSSLRKYSDMTAEHRKEIRAFIEVQLISYESNTAGWIFWNYKTEDAIEWDFKELVDKKLFPMPFGDYKYYNANGTFSSAMFSGAPSSLTVSSLGLSCSALVFSVFLWRSLGLSI